jgi:hypothetical protein
LSPLYELPLLYPQRTPWWYCKYSYHSISGTKARTLPLPRVAWVIFISSKDWHQCYSSSAQVYLCN